LENGLFERGGALKSGVAGSKDWKNGPKKFRTLEKIENKY